MKRLFGSALLIFAGLFCATAQNTVTYSLPQTSVHLKVTAEKESFVAGPYARFAQKYLGAAARTADATTYRLKSVDLTPYTEVNPAESYTLDLSRTDEGIFAFLAFSAQGLVSMGGGNSAPGAAWRFPAPAPTDAFSAKDQGENLTNATTTLYKSVVDGSSFSRVAVQQSEVVEKSLENKAAEAAQRIFDLRKARVQIITGDTDATYSGEAMGAAISEITRIEQEYLSLFYGLSETSEQTMHFDVVPEAARESQMYIAFRLSDTEGLLPSTDIAGRPFVLEFTVESRMKEPEPAAEPTQESAKKKKPEPEPERVHYRIPATTLVRLLDAENLLLQSRIPVFQLGTDCTFPLPLKTVKK